MLTLRTFGECRIEVAPDPAGGASRAPVLVLAPSADRLFSLALLLAGEAGRPVARGRAAAWLWPELDAGGARRRLRQALYRLRAAGVPVEADGDHLELPRAAVAPTFAASPSAAGLEAGWRAGTLRLGPCLAGWTPGAEAFAEWVEAYRARQEGAARAVLAAALDGGPADDGGRVAPPIVPPAVVARALLELDPAHARAARVLARGVPSPPAPRADEVGADPPLVGRAALMAALAERVRAACAGRGGAVWLDGAPGHGATRLLREVEVVAGRLGASVERIAGSRARALGDGPVGDAPIGDRTLGVARAAVARLLDRPGALGASPATLAALRCFAAGGAAPGAVRAGSSAERLLGARVAELVGAVVAERPVVLAVDGVGDADRRSLTLLTRAAAADDRAALVLWTGGDVGRGVAPASAGGADDALGGERYVLPPLGAADGEVLARAAAAAARATLSDEDAAWCAAAGAGVPRDVIALARHCAARPGSRRAPPAIAARLDGLVAALPARERRALQAAALLGRHATGARVARVGGDGRRALAALRRAGLLAGRGEGRDDGRVAPAHPFVAAAALAALGTGERRALHAAAAAALADDARAVLAAGGGAAAAAGGIVDAAVAHWRAARVPGAVAALLADARAALLAAGRAPEAAALLRRALDGAAPSGRKPARGTGAPRREVPELATLAAGALFAAGDARGAAAVAEGVAERAVARASPRRSPPHGPGDRAELLAIESAWRAGRPWAPLLARARRLAGDACAGTAERLEAVALAAALADNGAHGPLAGALADVGAALDALAGREDAPPRLALRAAMIYHASAGDLAAGVDAAAALARLLLARALAVDELGALIAAGDARRAGGDGPGAAGVYAQAHAAAARRGLAGYAARSALRAAAVACEGDDARAARDWAREGGRWAARAADDRLAWELADVRARVRLAGGDAAGADAAARAALAAVRAAPAATPRLWRAALTTAAEARLAVGGWRPDAPAAARPGDGRLLAAVLGAHRRLATRTGHDRTAVVAARALARTRGRAGEGRAGEGRAGEGRAAALAARYLREERRALGAPPAALAEFAAPAPAGGPPGGPPAGVR